MMAAKNRIPHWPDKVAARQRLHSHRQQGLALHPDVLGQGTFFSGATTDHKDVPEKFEKPKISIGTITSGGLMPQGRPTGWSNSIMPGR